MITYLNDRDWLLRYAFFDSVVDVAACLGGRNLEEYIFPLMTQALSGEHENFSLTCGMLTSGEDVEETNVAKVLSALTTLSELGLFQKMRLWELMSSTLPLLYHPNSWIKQGLSIFIFAVQWLNFMQAQPSSSRRLRGRCLQRTSGAFCILH